MTNHENLRDLPLQTLDCATNLDTIRFKYLLSVTFHNKGSDSLVRTYTVLIAPLDRNIPVTQIIFPLSLSLHGFMVVYRAVSGGRTYPSALAGCAFPIFMKQYCSECVVPVSSPG